MSNATALYDLTDSVHQVVSSTPGLTAAKIARRVRADVGTVRRVLTALVSDHYVAQANDSGRDVYRAA